VNLAGRQAATAAPTLLLCLDTLELAVQQARRAPAPAWTANAARLLDHARREGWIVAHVLRRPTDDRERWRAAEGLAPRPFERVFHRTAPSAFGHPEFAALAPCAAEVVMVGCSSDAAALATARDALAKGHALAIASDAVAAPQLEWARLASLTRPSTGEGRLTIQNTVRLIAAAPRLQVLEGGLASSPAAEHGRRHGGSRED
jgi:nicotinamidase-related amidase